MTSSQAPDKPAVSANENPNPSQFSFFGRLALEKDYVNIDQLQECVSIQLEFESLGDAPPRLGELLVSKGYLTEEQVQELLLLQKKGSQAAVAQPQKAQELTFKSGEIILQEGDEEHYDLFVLLSGAVEVYRREILLYEINMKGAFLGEIGTLLKCPRVATVVARNECKVFRVPEANVQAFFRSKPAMSLRLGEVLAGRLRAIIGEHVSAKDRATNAGEMTFGDALVVQENEEDRLCIVRVNDPERVFLNGQAPEDGTELNQEDNLQVGRRLFQIYYDHPGMMDLPEDVIEEEPEVEEAQEMPPEAEAVPFDLGDIDPESEAAIDAIVDSLEDEPFSDGIKKAMIARLNLYLELDELEQERNQLVGAEEAEETPEDLKGELDRQRRELERIPNHESLVKAIEKIQLRLEKDKEPPIEGEERLPLTEPMKRAYDIAIRQKQILIRRWESTPALLHECSTYCVCEPLYAVFEKLNIRSDRLYGWAVFAMAVDDYRKYQEKQQKQARESAAEKREAANRSGFLGMTKRMKPEDEESVRKAEGQERKARVLTSGSARELNLIEKEMVTEFWRVYHDAACALISGVDKADEPYLRAFLRYALLGSSPRFMPRQHSKSILKECSRGCPEINPSMEGHNIFYADELMELVAKGKVTPSANEDLELNHRNSPEWRADRAWRRMIHCNMLFNFYRETLEQLQVDMQENQKAQAALEKRMTLVPKGKEGREKLSGLRQELQGYKVRATRYEHMIDRLQGDLMPKQASEAERARSTLHESGVGITQLDLVKHEIAYMRRGTRLLARLKEPFLPFQLRERYAPDRQCVNTRDLMAQELDDVEKRDPLLFQDTLLPNMKKKQRVLIRYAPNIIITPGGGEMGFLASPRAGADCGRILFPAYFQRKEQRRTAIYQVLADYRYDTSKASAGMDMMTSETLVAAYAQIRWDWRKRDKQIRQKAGIWTEENERTNWRRHYAFYMNSALDNGKTLFYKCSDLYELIVGKYIELPEGGEKMRK